MDAAGPRRPLPVRRACANAQGVVLTEAEKENAARRLDEITGIWFGGGDPSRPTATLLHTPVETAIRALHRRGAVLGGTSADAAVISTPMLTGDEKHPGGARAPESVAVVFDAREGQVTAPAASPPGAAGVGLHVLPAGSRFDPAMGRAPSP